MVIFHHQSPHPSGEPDVQAMACMFGGEDGYCIWSVIHIPKISSMNLDPRIDFLLERGVMYPPSVVAHVSPKSLLVCAGQESNTQ